MPKKTVKELEGELKCVRNEFGELSQKFNDLLEKYDKLEKTINNLKLSFKCDRCDEMFGRKRDLQMHAKRHISVLPGPFKCDECAKTFNEEWKLNAHKNSHKRYSCDQCDKTFSNQIITDKHKKIAHGTSKIYCHFFNNTDLPCRNKLR